MRLAGLAFIRAGSLVRDGLHFFERGLGNRAVGVVTTAAER